MNKGLLAMGMLWVLAARAEGEVEAFKDKGDLFMRAGSKQGLRVGGDVLVLGDTIGDTTERRVLGRARIIEVLDHLARLQPDAAAAKLPEIKWVKALPRVIPKLKGHASISGFGPARRVSVHNDSPGDWTRCDVHLPPNRHYVLGTLKANDSEGILWHRFVADASPGKETFDGVRMTCAQGVAQWRFSD